MDFLLERVYPILDFLSVLFLVVIGVLALLVVVTFVIDISQNSLITHPRTRF